MNAMSHRVLGAVATTLSGAALLGSGAYAADRPDDRGGMLGVGAMAVVAPTDVVERAIRRHVDGTVPDIVERAVRQHAGATVPDVVERAVARATSPVVRPDDRGGARLTGLAESTPLPTDATSQEDGIAWADAAFGAAAAALVVLLVGALATVTILHRRRVVVR